MKRDKETHIALFRCSLHMSNFVATHSIISNINIDLISVFKRRAVTQTLGITTKFCL